MFKEEIPEELKEKINILHISKTGSVYTAIVKGDTEKIENEINAYNPLVFDKVSLTLEEVFIYELGGLGYDFENIIV